MTQPGDHLGPYEIVAPLDAGAMGQVFRARDVRLSRNVALKVLPQGRTDPSYLARFEREARAACAIDHPNVVTVHDVGAADGTAWIAMELVEGPTLRELLQEGRLPVGRALALAAQIADGLAAAHEHGVVHRDLKPANVKITPAGLVKILDFGLARLDRPHPDTLRELDTRSTVDGVLVGTLAYMSPEQAAGRPVDFRSDQFSLGSVLYEMLAGDAPFRRGDPDQTIVAIRQEERKPLPPLDPVADIPLHWILDRCLAKDREARYASTRDLARDLHRLRQHLDNASEARRRERPLRARRNLTRLAVPLACAAAAAALAWLLAARRPLAPPRFSQLTFDLGHVVAARFVPGRDTVVYSAGWQGAPFSLYRKDPQGPESVKVELPPGWLQAVSARGTVLFVATPRILLPGRPLGMLAEAPLAGGAPRDVAEQVQFADLGPAEEEMAVVLQREGMTVLEYPRGRPLFETAGWISSPRVARSGRLVAFVDHPIRADERGHIVVVDRSGQRRLVSRLWAVVRGLAWAPSGDEVWFAASPGDELSALRAIALSGATRVLARAPGPLRLQDVAANGEVLVTRETRHLCISALLPDGTTRELTWLDSSLLADLSDDGGTLLFTELGEAGGIRHTTFLRRVDGSPPTRLGEGVAKALSPDGRWALSIVPSDSPDLVLLPTHAGEPRRVNRGGLAYHSAGFLPDAARVLVAAGEPGKGVWLYVQGLDAGGMRAVSAHEIMPDHFQGFPVSPDGAWVAIVDTQGGIALRAVDRDETRTLSGLAPGTLPVRWTRDGRGLFVFRPDEVPARILRVDVATGATQPWLQVAPLDRTGVHIFPAVRLSADGRTCVYSYARLLTVLYLVEGLQ